MADWQTQLQTPAARRYVPIPKHGGSPTQGRIKGVGSLYGDDIDGDDIDGDDIDGDDIGVRLAFYTL